MPFRSDLSLHLNESSKNFENYHASYFSHVPQDKIRCSPAENTMFCSATVLLITINKIFHAFILGSNINNLRGTTANESVFKTNQQTDKTLIPFH